MVEHGGEVLALRQSTRYGHVLVAAVERQATQVYIESAHSELEASSPIPSISDEPQIRQM